MNNDLFNSFYSLSVGHNFRLEGLVFLQFTQLVLKVLDITEALLLGDYLQFVIYPAFYLRSVLTELGVQ